jgi:hypothetical protein
VAISAIMALQILRRSNSRGAGASAWPSPSSIHPVLLAEEALSGGTLPGMLYILRWHSRGVRIVAIDHPPRGAEHFATIQAARRVALAELTERAEDFEARARSLREAITRLEAAQKEDLHADGLERVPG